MGQSPLTGWEYAHRGLYNNRAAHPENSLAAFEKAMQAGMGIELDVQETLDHVLVVYHDETLERTCGDPRSVCEVLWEELQSLRLFGSKQTIPTLDEVLSLVHGRVPLMVEIKSTFRSPSIAERVCLRLRRYPGPYCVESFDPRVLRYFKKHAPDVIRGQLSLMLPLKDKPVAIVLRNIALGCLLVNCIGRPDFISYGYQTAGNPSFRFIARLFRPVLVAWTVQDEQTYRALQEYYDAQITENGPFSAM